MFYVFEAKSNKPIWSLSFYTSLMKFFRRGHFKGVVFILSNSCWQLAFADMIADVISIIPFLVLQKIAKVIFLSLLKLKERNQICRRETCLPA